MSNGNDHNLETYRSLVTLAAQTLKVLQLLNGGAIVALLAYLGQVSNRGEIAPSVMCSTILFVIGLVAAVAAHFGAYFTQLARFNQRSDASWLTGTAILGFVSLALFAAGALTAVSIFSA